jgi:hypothetical protein
LVVAFVSAFTTHAGDSELPLPTSRLAWILVIYGVSAYLVLFLVRLDFDGDFFDNWLPQARYHHLLNRHEPAAILKFGTMQGASYPPGYGIFLSTLMAAVDLPREESFSLSPDTSFFILVYRVIVFAINLAFLVLLVVYLADIAGLGVPAALVCVGVAMLLIRTLIGQHIAAETLLFPLLGSAVLLIATGRAVGSWRLTAVGLAVGSLATLVKWEATILFLVGVLPWLLCSPREQSGRSRWFWWIGWAAIIAVGVIPVIVWKKTVGIDNGFYRPITPYGLIAELPRLPELAFRAVRMIINDGRILALLALPAALAVVCRGKALRTAWIVPTTTLALFIGWVVVYLFCTGNAVHTLDTSYDRLVMLPTFSALLYSFQACAGASVSWRHCL